MLLVNHYKNNLFLNLMFFKNHNLSKLMAGTLRSKFLSAKPGFFAAGKEKKQHSFDKVMKE
jgi:hypothetical protein